MSAERRTERLAHEASAYLRAVEGFAAAGHDPHGPARTRARLARQREAAADEARAYQGTAGDPAEPSCSSCGRATAWPVSVCAGCSPAVLAAHEREARRAARLAAAERKRDRLLAPFRFAPCPRHGIEPCPDDCGTLRERLRAAGIDPEADR